MRVEFHPNIYPKNKIKSFTNASFGEHGKFYSVEKQPDYSVFSPEQYEQRVKEINNRYDRQRRALLNVFDEFDTSPSIIREQLNEIEYWRKGELLSLDRLYFHQSQI